MTKTADQGAGQSGAKRHNRCGPTGPLPWMTHDEARPGAVMKSAGGARLRLSRIPIARCAVRNLFRLVPLLRVSPGPSCYFTANPPGTRATRDESPQLRQPETDFGPGSHELRRGTLAPCPGAMDGRAHPGPSRANSLTFSLLSTLGAGRSFRRPAGTDLGWACPASRGWPCLFLIPA